MFEQRTQLNLTSHTQNDDIKQEGKQAVGKKGFSRKGELEGY